MHSGAFPDSIAIVGAGQAAVRAAQALRTLGYSGPIAMFGDETHRPYERPPLSKAVLQAGDATLPWVLSDAAFDALNVVHHAGTRVQRLDPAARQLHLSDGRIESFAKCLLATGGRARSLPGLPPAQRGVQPGVHYLRSWDDAIALRAALIAGQRLGVIGGGFLGLEAAMSARAQGMQVCVIEAGPSLLGRFVPADLSQWLAKTLAAHAIDLRLDCVVRDVEIGHDAIRLRLAAAKGADRSDSPGDTVQADQMLVSIGLQPEVDLARQAGLTLHDADGGILVDEHGRTSDPDVFAAGDCASQFRPSLGRIARLESWQNANEQAQAAAAGMLGLPTPAPAYPWFWTDIGPHNLQMLGLAAPDLSYVRRGDPDAQGRALWLGLRQGVPVHGVALNAGGDLRALRPLLERRISIQAQAFADEATSLRMWTKTVLSSSSPQPA